MVHEHGSLLAAARLSFASSWARWRTGTVAWGTKALGGIGERPNCSASSLKLATAKSLNISWKFYFAVLWLQQDSLNGVRYKLSAEVIYERSLQGSFNLDHNNGRITQKNLFFLFLFFHFILWQADLPGVAFRSLCHAPWSRSCAGPVRAWHRTRCLWASLEVCPCLLRFLPNAEVRGSYDRSFSISP